MKAVVLDQVTKAEDIALVKTKKPVVREGWVLIKIKAFGLNHSESILRLNEIKADHIHKPIIPGIECAGIIEDPSDSDFKKGEKVIAFMGGMGRSFNGSYAQYVLMPISHVFSIHTDLDWKQIAAVPETYYTAYGSLFEALKLKKEDVLLIRGATCALGYASIQLAITTGCKVIATTHKKEKFDLLKEADQVVLDTGVLSGTLKGVTRALELVGPKTLKDTMRCMKKDGIVCVTGILGGVFTLDRFDPIKAIPNEVYLTSFYSNFPTQQAVDDLFDRLETNHLLPKIGKTYSFSQIKEACIALDEGKVNGKIVVEMEE